MVAGRQPEPRSFHTATAIADKRVVVFGGRSPSNEHYNDFHIFDTGNPYEMLINYTFENGITLVMTIKVIMCV